MKYISNERIKLKIFFIPRACTVPGYGLFIFQVFFEACHHITPVVSATTIVVGHSIDAIKGSTTVCVLEDGCISEQGDMGQLLQMNQESRFKKYVQS